MNDWPHLQDITGSESDNLKGKLIVIAVCGSIACIEIHRVARLLMRHGAKVQFVLTAAASELVSATSLSWCTGRPVIQSLSARCEHLEYFGERGCADLLLIAPVTANTLAKIALGLDDNVVTTCVTTALGTGMPVLCAPGMHAPMMRNPAVLKNLQTVQKLGVEILASTPAEGKEKMMGAENMVAHLLRLLSGRPLSGKKVLITGGPTREFLDPARCLTNPSSGLTACLLAGEAYRLGAEVELIYGPGKVEPDPWIEVVRIDTAGEMLKAAKASVERAIPDVIVAAAAVCDFAPAERLDHKRPTADGGWDLKLQPTEKVIGWLRENAPASLLVAFKAASSSSDQELSETMDPYLREGRADLVVGNSVVLPDQGFESPGNRYLVAGVGTGSTVLGPDSKKKLAQLLWSLIFERLNGSLIDS